MFKNEDLIEKLQGLKWYISPWLFCISPLCFSSVLASFSGRPFPQVCSGHPWALRCVAHQPSYSREQRVSFKKRFQGVSWTLIGSSWVTCLPLNQSQWSRSWNTLDSPCLGQTPCPRTGRSSLPWTSSTETPEWLFPNGKPGCCY